MEKILKLPLTTRGLEEQGVNRFPINKFCSNLVALNSHHIIFYLFCVVY